MAFLFALGALFLCLPGTGYAATAAAGSVVADGFLVRRKLVEVERLIFLGLPIVPSEAEAFLNTLTLWDIPGDDLPDKLKFIAGSYIFNNMEMDQLMDAIRHIDISQDLGGDFAREFNDVVKKGPKGAAFRTTFETHGVDISKLLTFGKRRLEDPLLKAMMDAAA
jgi:hypothetical protein